MEVKEFEIAEREGVIAQREAEAAEELARLQEVASELTRQRETFDRDVKAAREAFTAFEQEKEAFWFERDQWQKEKGSFLSSS